MKSLFLISPAFYIEMWKTLCLPWEHTEMKAESVNPGVERFKQGGGRREGYERVRWGRVNQNKVGLEKSAWKPTIL